MAACYFSYMLAVNRNVFLRIYIFVPFCYLVYFLDRQFFGQALLGSSYRSIYDVLPLTIIFNLPHILASSMLLLKYKSFAASKKQNWRIFLLCGAMALSLTTSLKTTAILVFGFWTAYHVVAQQFGVVKIFGIQPTKIYSTWKWVGISTAMLILLRHAVGIYSQEIIFLCRINIVVLFFVSIALTKQNNKVDQSFSLIWVNFILAVSSIFFDQLGYYLLATLLNQFVHDVTAFYFYIIHNLNFEMNRKKSVLGYFEKIEIGVRTVLIPVLLCVPLNLGWLGTATMIFSYFIAMIHYSTESFIWNRNSALRSQLVVS